MKYEKNILEEKYLYKYRAIAKDSSDHTKPDLNKFHYIERIFTHNELYFPSPSSLNDPFECRPFTTLGDISNPQYKKRYISYFAKAMIAGGNTADPKEITQWLGNHTQEKANDFSKQLTDELRASFTKYRICSFSAVNNNPLLWSHYSDSHKGFCLIFDADNDLFGNAMSMVYQDEYPSYDFTEEDDYTVMKNSAFVKFTDWSYEKEFRLTSAEPNYENSLAVKDNIWSFPEGMLKGVIFGYKISDFDRDLIEKLCLNHSEKLYFKKATLHDNKFYMEIHCCPVKKLKRGLDFQ